jgi:hypothetical protein
MLIDHLKMRIKDAMKSGRSVEKEILRVALGEIQTEEARAAGKRGDESGYAILKKLVKSNEETLAVTEAADQRKILEEELAVLRSLLPKSLGLDEIIGACAPVAEQIRTAAGDGQATGIAMKHLKSAGVTVDGKIVAQAVQAMRQR